jgi:hypothetical protein
LAHCGLFSEIGGFGLNCEGLVIANGVTPGNCEATVIGVGMYIPAVVLGR